MKGIWSFFVLCMTSAFDGLPVFSHSAKRVFAHTIINKRHAVTTRTVFLFILRPLLFFQVFYQGKPVNLYVGWMKALFFTPIPPSQYPPLNPLPRGDSGVDSLSLNPPYRRTA
jgi:hypothetical protein